MNTIVTICAMTMLSLSGVLCGSAFALTPEQIIDWGNDIKQISGALHELNAVNKVCTDNVDSGMDTELFNTCADFYKSYSKHLKAVLSESNTTVSITLTK
jgi:hypothetical protein